MPVGPISLLGAVLVGTAVLWAVRLLYGTRRSTSDDTVRLILTIAGWTLVHIGLLSLALQLFFIPPNTSQGILSWLGHMTVGSLMTVPFVMAVLGMAAARFRALESTSLMWLLSAAGERAIPLAEMVRSYAEERTDEVGLRAARLADLLESGVNLPDALEQSGTQLPIDGVLAARYGTETGDLRNAIRGLCGGTEEVDRLVRTAIEKGCYLGFLICIATLQWTFMDLRILPILSMMFEEFQVQLPPITRFVIQLSEHLNFVGPPLLFLFFLLWLGFAVLGFLYYLGWLPRDLVFLGRLTRRYDSALIMRALAVAIRQQKPVGRAIWVLSRIYPRRSVRRRLQNAGTRVNNGEDWCQSLCRHRLIQRGDAAVFQAAQRVGNLEWALAEMADSALRRINHRLMLWLNVVFPVTVLLIGLALAVAVTAYFAPLVDLIGGLS